MRKAVTVAAVLLTLTACGSRSAIPSLEDSTEVITVTVHGQPVTCVTFDNVNGGGISCDWDSAGEVNP